MFTILYHLSCSCCSRQMFLIRRHFGCYPFFALLPPSLSAGQMDFADKISGRGREGRKRKIVERKKQRLLPSVQGCQMAFISHNFSLLTPGNSALNYPDTEAIANITSSGNPVIMSSNAFYVVAAATVSGSRRRICGGVYAHSYGGGGELNNVQWQQKKRKLESRCFLRNDAARFVSPLPPCNMRKENKSRLHRRWCQNASFTAASAKFATQRQGNAFANVLVYVFDRNLLIS